jgi:tetratricopeptide (TPR) repeat protein
MLRAMAAAATLPELPPLTPLALVRTDDAALAAAEALVTAGRHADAASALRELWADVRQDPALALRQRLALAWAELYRGELDEAARLLEHAEALVASPRFDAADRAEVLFRRGCVAFNRQQVADATTLLTRALDANERSPRPRQKLAARAHEWRSRCHVFQRDFDAAGRDVERALEASTACGDRDAESAALFQASIVAERQQQWLMARCYAEQALELQRRLGNALGTARVLNNLGGIAFVTGDLEAAEASLLEAIETASTACSDPDFAQAVNSLAQVYLESGRPAEARARALRAIELLDGRADFLDELGAAQLVVARSLQAEGDPAAATQWLDAVEASFVRLGSTSHLATVWVARADLARELGDVERAADLYRQAATSLQDLRF